MSLMFFGKIFEIIWKFWNFEKISEFSLIDDEVWVFWINIKLLSNPVAALKICENDSHKNVHEIIFRFIMQNTGKRCVILLVFILLRWSFNYESNVFRYNKILIDCVFGNSKSISIYFWCKISEFSLIDDEVWVFWINIKLLSNPVAALKICENDSHCRSIVLKTMDRSIVKQLEKTLKFFQNFKIFI
jgi:hypothetical protein